MNTGEIASKLFERRCVNNHPNAENIIIILKKIRMAMFPGNFHETGNSKITEQSLESLLASIHSEFAKETNNETATGLIITFADLQQILYKDAQAGFDGEPAARSVDI